MTLLPCQKCRTMSVTGFCSTECREAFETEPQNVFCPICDTPFIHLLETRHSHPTVVMECKHQHRTDPVSVVHLLRLIEQAHESGGQAYLAKRHMNYVNSPKSRYARQLERVRSSNDA